MKTYKVREGQVIIDGVTYGSTPTAYEVKGKSGGKIQSINIQGIQFFPISGVFVDDTIPVVEDSIGLQEETPIKKPKAKKVK